MNYSQFGKKFSRQAGILSLMKDMGEALASGNEDLIMMGGGNPANIPQFQGLIQKKLQDIAADEKACRRLVGTYISPQGELDFIAGLARLLRNEYGWRVGPENICLTNGSQTGFFLLLNMFAGDFGNGLHKKVRLPLAPEYIGYADIGLSDNFFVNTRPKIEHLDNHLFKYRVNFDQISIGEETGAICVSRPTNPTGNVVTDSEIEHLDLLARTAGVPLIIDNAYGLPFPGIIFTEANPIWNENIVVCLSLSKLGMPAARTGIIIANPEIISILSGLNAIMSLSPAGFGAILANDLVASGEIITFSRTIIRPFYQRKVEGVVKKLAQELAGTPYRIHTPEGAIFLWLWLQDLPISSNELYNRLKKRGVLVISGHYFFPGLENDDWQHKNECIRINYAEDDALVQRGLVIIAEEVKRAYRQG